MAEHQLRKVSITHDAIIDHVMARPEATYRDIARAFGYTPEGIGIICRSDAFKARLEARKADLVDPLIVKSIEERLNGLAHASIDILMGKLADSEDTKLALAALDATTRHTAAAYGARSGNTVGNTTFVVQLPGPASNTAEWSKAFNTKIPEVTLVEPKE